MPQVRFEEIAGNFAPLAEAKKPHLFAAMVAESVGLCDGNGNLNIDSDTGRPKINKDAKRKPSDYNFGVLAEAMIGRNWKDYFGFGNSNKVFPFMQFAQEEASAPIGPSVFANIAAWSATVGGLLGAQFNLGYEMAPFELVDLFPMRPMVFWQGGERYIDVIAPFQPAQATGPGVEYPDNSMSALWVEPGPMKKYAGKILLTKEALAIDISGGQILSQANQGGWTIRYRENEEVISLITGQTNNWKLGMLTDTSATAYNTYGPTINGTAIPNDFVNPLNDVGALQQSDEKISTLIHPVTGLPLVENLDVAIFPTRMSKWAQWLLGIGDWQNMTQTTVGPAQPPPGTFPTAVGTNKNPWQNMLRPVVSRWLDFRQTNSTTQTDPNLTAGLGLTGAATYRWYRLNPAKFACKRQAWAANSQAISASDYVMATQGIAAAFTWDIAFMMQVLSGYAIQRNRGA